MSYYRTFLLKLLLIPVLLAPLPVQAQDAAPGPAPTLPKFEYSYPFDDAMMAQQLAARPMLIELFTSLDCLFCPRAEHLMADMAIKTRAIALICHTDPEGDEYPLGRNVCSDRQARYAGALSDGLMYTPQLVINGHLDAVGHEFDDVGLALQKAFRDTLVPLGLTPSSEAGIYTLSLPDIDLGKGASADIVIASYRTPYTVPKTMRQSSQHPDPLIRVVDRMLPLGGWDGHKKSMPVSFVPDQTIAGFVVMVQRNDGVIVAAADSKDVVAPSAAPNATP